MRLFLIVIASCLFCFQQAEAVILLNQENNDTLITTDPGTGVPWKNVAQVTNSSSSPAGSAVYLGSQYILTANHVNPTSKIILDGQEFTVDTSFNQGGYTNGSQRIGTADLKVVRLSSDPELVVNGLVDINLNTNTILDRNRSVTLIGFGQGRGTEVTDQGWTWGGGTEDQRWGTNTTLNNTFTDGNTSFIATEFNDGAGNTESAATLNDSGSGLFFEFAGTWYLAGITTSVDNAGQSFYDNDAGTPGDQPDRTFYARVSSYHSEISDAIAVIPEPSTFTLLTLGLISLWSRRRRLK